MSTQSFRWILFRFTRPKYNFMNNKYMYFVGLIVVGLTVFVFALLFLKKIPKENSEVLNMAIGAIMAKFGSVVDYFFGSSKSSADKTVLMNEHTKN